MVQLPAVPDSATHPACVETPVGDYELLDFGGGRRLERWGPYLVERSDRLAVGERSLPHWQPDWVYVEEVGPGGHWEPTGSGLQRRWQVEVGGVPVLCQLGRHGRVGVHVRDLVCGHWLRERIEGCYDLDEIRVLNLFGGNGFISAQAVTAGASVVHVEADEEQLALAREQVGEHQIRFVRDDVMDQVEDLLRRQQRFEMIVLPAPPLGHGPKGQLWDREVDMPKLIAYLPRLVSDDCLGIWLSTDAGAIYWKPESLADLLRDALPGRSVEPLRLGLSTADGRLLPAGAAARWFDATEFLQTGTQPLTAAQLEERLDVHMLSAGAAEDACQQLAECPREQQDFVLHWVAVAAHANAGMAFNFVTYVCPALRLMGTDGVQAWLLHCMDIYDTKGLHPAVVAFKDAEGFAHEYKARQTGLAFDEVVTVLEPFVHGLNGRKLKVEVGEQSYTDSESLFLPAIITRFPERERNFQLYKTLLVHQWAQTWFGTWQLDVGAVLAGYADSTRALQVFHALETIRLDACIARELPGLYRQMLDLREATGAVDRPAEWDDARRALTQPEATVQDGVHWLRSLYQAPVPVPAPYAGAMLPERVAAVCAARLINEKQLFRLQVARMVEEQQRKEALQNQQDDAPEQDEVGTSAPREVKLAATPDAEAEQGVLFEFTLDDRPVAPPDDLKGTMASIWQDLGEIPPDYLEAAGEGAYYAGAIPGGSQDPDDVWKGTYHEEGAHHYNEWDYERQQYRKNWAVLREMTVTPRDPQFVPETLLKYRGLTGELRRTFEALRGEDKLLKRQLYGDDVDIDALVEAYADVKNGLEMTDRLFTKMHKQERNIAVMFMVDMSGSTKGWINDAERESLVLLCESLETLGDRYAIYGFSGMTRKRCEVYKVKGFDEDYNDEVRGRISGIRPKDYTRMGVTIRHLCKILREVEARTKLLITLSDGKPDDYDSYRGAYGIEDTRMALYEAKREGIHPFCITIDTEAKDYLSHMYGAVNYAVIDEVRKLPLKVSDIYRRLTT